MSRVVRTYAVPGQGGYYYEDIEALQSRSVAEADRWRMAPQTPGFRYAREVSEVLCVGIELENGCVLWGDCVGVSYGGKSGRDPVFRVKEGLALWNSRVVPRLQGATLNSYREFLELADDPQLPSAMRYGLSQVLLNAVAASKRLPPTQILCEEFGLPLPSGHIALQGSSGNDREAGADKMIIHRLEALPHSQVDDLVSQFGTDGQVLIEYAVWLSRRIRELQDAQYQPIIDLDVHGAIGKAFQNDYAKMAAYLGKLAKAAAPFALRIESPIILSSREEQLMAMKKLREKTREAGLRVQLAVDEWVNSLADVTLFAGSGAADLIHVKMPNLGAIHNSLHAVQICQAHGVSALLGGSCIETDFSTRASVHLALAVQPDVFLVKPGMGINEAVSIVRNEMNRTLAMILSKKTGAAH